MYLSGEKNNRKEIEPRSSTQCQGVSFKAKSTKNVLYCIKSRRGSIFTLTNKEKNECFKSPTMFTQEFIFQIGPIAKKPGIQLLKFQHQRMKTE